MAGLKGRAVTSEIALSAATAKTIIQIVAASNHRVKVTEIWVSFDGVTSTDAPANIRILRQSTAGTMSALSPVKHNDSDDETLQTTAQHTATVEPTAGDVLAHIHVHPQGGRLQPIHLADPLWIKGGGRIGVEITSPAAVNALATVAFEE